jgi:hypothetical protein
LENDNHLNSFINDCINIENNIAEINIIDNKIKNSNSIHSECNIIFFPKEDKIEPFLQKIRSFGKISNDFFKYSAILSPNDDNIFILDQIENSINQSIKSITLIYRATRDGDSYDNFFNKCNEKKNIIMIIKSDNNSIFGGFTQIGFIKVSKQKFQDDNAFVFSLINKKIYPVKKSSSAIRCCSCCCPQFYSSTIYLKHDFLKHKNNCVGGKNDNYEGFIKDYELNNGNSNFKVLELEIYQINFM